MGAQLEGWVHVATGENEPNKVREALAWHVLSEATQSSRGRGRSFHSGFPHPGMSHVFPMVTALSARDRRSRFTDGLPTLRHHKGAPSSEALWLSLCDSLLFISFGPDEGAPVGFCHLDSVAFEGLDPGKGIISLINGHGSPMDFGSGENSEPPKPLKLVFLLPDGRWVPFEVARLDIEVLDKTKLEEWVNAFSRLSLSFPSMDNFMGDDWECNRVSLPSCSHSAPQVSPSSSLESGSVAFPGRMFRAAMPVQPLLPPIESIGLPSQPGYGEDFSLESIKKQVKARNDKQP